jgi:hypothetical protein
MSRSLAAIEDHGSFCTPNSLGEYLPASDRIVGYGCVQAIELDCRRWVEKGSHERSCELDCSGEGFELP